jgi:Double zinc ribbon
MWELVAGLFVALAALALVLEPVALARVRGSAGSLAAAPEDDSDLEDLTESDSPKIKALLALKEIEFDRATGKISDEDYPRLKARYESEAIAAIKAEEQAAKHDVAVADRAEAAIRRARERAGVGRRECPSCGPRPEDHAAFCSHCGRSLVTASAPRCSQCGAQLADGAKFCAECGGAIAA